MVLSCSRIDGVAGGYMICSAQMTIFIAARGKASCIHSRIACAFARLRRPKAPPRVTFLPFPPPGCRLPACGEGHPKLAAPAPPEIGKILSSALQQSDERRH